MNNDILFERLRQWLVSMKGFGKNSASDVLSRLRRLEKISPYLLQNDNQPYYLYQLSEIEGFRKLSMSVKSQLRRSKKLLDEFLLYEEGGCSIQISKKED